MDDQDQPEAKTMTGFEMMTRRRLMGISQERLAQSIRRTRWSVVQYEKGTAPIPPDVADQVLAIFSARNGGRPVTYSWQSAADVMRIGRDRLASMLVKSPGLASLSPEADPDMAMADRLQLQEGDINAPFMTMEDLEGMAWAAGAA